MMAAQSPERQARAARVVELYESGLSYSRVAELEGISINTVHRDLKLLDVQPRDLGSAISAGRLAMFEAARGLLIAQAGGCGSPTCTDPECRVPPGQCHRTGCLEAATIASTTDAPKRRLAGYATMYCSASCVGLARAARRRHATGRCLGEPGGCGSPTCDDPSCTVATGACHRSGCDRQAVVADHTDTEKRWREGQPIKFCSKECAGAAGAAAIVAYMGQVSARLRQLGRVPTMKAAGLLGLPPYRVRTELAGERFVFGDRLVRFGVDPYAVVEASKRDAAVCGRLNIELATINRKTVGPARQSSSDEQAEVFRLRGQGLSIREIARQVFGGESEASGRGKVARLLKTRAVT